LSGRSRTRLAAVGSRAIAAGVALRDGDGATLAELGLDLAELGALDPFDQCNRILDAVVESASMEEAEARRAAASALLTLLEPGPADAVVAIQVFVTECVFQAWLTEVGQAMRESRRAAPSLATERRVRGFIEARVRTAPIAADARSMTASALQGLISDTLAAVRRLTR
jgi:hypothetical protein